VDYPYFIIAFYLYKQEKRYPTTYGIEKKCMFFLKTHIIDCKSVE